MTKRSKAQEGADLFVEPVTIIDKVIWSTCSSTKSKLKKGLAIFILNVSVWIESIDPLQI